MSKPTPVIPQVHEVSFNGNNLFLVEHDGQPFVPMRPVIEGMGLDWKSQYSKLNSNRERWGCVVINTTQVGDTQSRKFVSLPLSKMFGFICTIQPTKIRNELRPTITKFQNECDDVLWSYWEKKVKPTASKPDQEIPQLPPPVTTLTPEQQHAAKKQVERLARESELMPRIAFSRIWTDIKDHFKVATYKDIPSSLFPELMRMLGAPVQQPAYPGVKKNKAQASRPRLDRELEELVSAAETVVALAGDLFEANQRVGRGFVRMSERLIHLQSEHSRTKRAQEELATRLITFKRKGA